MSQTGYTPILIYSSSTGGNSPAAGNLTNSTLGSELAINIADGKLFYKDSGGSVQVIGWKTVPTSAGGTGLTSYTAGDVLYYASGTALSKLAIGSSGAYMSSSGSAPQWTAPAALTKTDDTNVTLTLGGSASTALLNAASLTLGWTGQLATTRGGTGLSSFTANGVLYASSTSGLSTGSNLQFDGTNLGIGGSPNSWFFASVGLQIPSGALTSYGSNVQNLSMNAYLNSSATWTYITTNAAALYQQSNNTHSWSVAPSGTAGNPITWTNALGIDGSANVTVNTGNLVIGTSGKGIDFSATSQAGGMTSELLSDYEEGTWTPSIGGGVVFSSASGTYTKIGNTVVCSFNFVVSTGGTVNTVGGLPFSVNGTTNNGCAREYANTGFMWNAQAVGSSTTFNFRRYDNGSTLVVNDQFSGTVIFKV